MGWLSYIILLIGFVIAVLIYAVITGIMSFNLFIGWILVLIANPFFMIFTARYFGLVYDQGEPQPVQPAPVG
jgi:multisubunit Na+/H+ antiporter MnhG subunit